MRPEILAQHGRRAARLIADARKGDPITASVRWLGIDRETLATLERAGVVACDGVDWLAAK